MAYDEKLAERIRAALGERAGVTEKKMFGGVAFLLRGNMFCGLIGDELMVRVGPANHARALEAPHARPMDFTGRPMKGYVFVAAAGIRTAAGLTAWVTQGMDFVATLPAKPSGNARRARKHAK